MRWIPLLVGLFLAPSVAAAPIPFGEAITRAGGRADLAQGRKATDAHAALARQLSGQTDHPNLTVYPGWRFGPAEERRIEVQAQLSQAWSLSGLADARREALQAEGRALRAAVSDRDLVVRLTAARAWIDRWAAQARLAAERQALADATRFAALVAEAVSAGAATVDARAEARAEAAQAHLAVVDAEGDVVDAGHALGRAVGARDGQPVGAAGALPRPPLPDAAARAALIQKAADLPGPLRLRLAAAAAQARVAEARAEAGSRLQGGAMLQVDDGVVAFGMVGITWPVFDGGERVRAGARAEALTARGQAARAEVEAAHQLAQALHEVGHARENEATLDDELLPALEALVAARDAAFAAGQVTVFDVLRARGRLVRARRDRVAARAHRAWAEVAAWILLAAADGGEAP